MYVVGRNCTLQQCPTQLIYSKYRFEIFNISKCGCSYIVDHLSIGFDVVVECNKSHETIAVLRSNHSFFVEIMRFPEGLIDQLRLCDCLTDVQSRLLKRQTVTSGKRKLINRNNSSDLLHFISSCDDIRRSDCFRSLRQSSQKLVMKVIDNGGGMP